jgi:murein L,D-transpeptidase YafK
MLRLTAIFLLAALPSCKGQRASAQAPFVVETCDSLPGPDRARAAAERVRPGLQHDLGKLGLRLGDPVFLRAFKEEGELEVWVRNRDTGKYDKFRTYRVAAQSGTLGPKLAEGDGQVPEGFYHVPRSAMKPDSTFHLAFNIGYPNAYDRHHGRDGSFIMVHGNQVSIGCLAMTDAKIEEIYTLCDAALTNGQKFFRIHIFPFRMSDGRMKRAEKDRWYSFWQEIREGYRWFETHRLPPDASVRDGKYHFAAGS